MTDIVYQDDRVAQAQALWTHQFLGKTVVDAITDVLTAESQALEDLYNVLRYRLDLSQQTGIQLDRLGALVGESRKGRLDDEYRLWIQARRLVNRSSGGTRDMYAVAQTLLGTALTLYLEQIPTGHVMHLLSYADVDHVALQRILQETSATGVPFFWSYVTGNYDRFTLGSGSTPTALSPNGFDDGRFIDWLGPEQSPQYYARLQEIFPMSLVDAWDCRAAKTNVDLVQRVQGANSVLETYGDTLALSSTLLKESIAGVDMGGDDALYVQRSSLTSVFTGASAWTVAFYFGGAASRVCAVVGDPDALSGTDAVRIYYSGGSIYLDRSGVTASYAPSGTPNAVIVSYDGAGGVTFWADGTQGTDALAHADLNDLQYFLWGDPAFGGSPNVPMHALCVLDRVISHGEAQTLTESLERSFTDNAYY